MLHAHDEVMTTSQPDRSTSGLAMLRTVAAVAIEEFRIERRVAEFGYPTAGLAAADSLNNELFDFCCEVLEAPHNPSSDDVILFANLRYRRQ